MADSSPDDRRAAEASAMRFLSRRDHSRQELRDKLMRKELDGAVVDEVLDELTAHGWLDDRRFASEQADILVRRQWGPVQISRRLRDHGVSEELASHVVAGLEETTDWRERCRERLERKFGPAEQLSRKESAKAFRHLSYRGYPGAIIRSVLFDGA